MSENDGEERRVLSNRLINKDLIKMKLEVGRE